MRWRHPRQSTQQSIKEGGTEGGRAIGAEQMPPPTHCPVVGCHRRESGYQIDRLATTERRPPAKEHSRLLSGRIYLFGAFDIVGFSAPSLPSTPSCLPRSSPAVRRPSGIPGRRAPSRRNIKSVSERRYLSSRNYRGIYGPVSFVNCTRWAGSGVQRRVATTKRSGFLLRREGDIYLIKWRWQRRSRSESRPLFCRPARG